MINAAIFQLRQFQSPKIQLRQSQSKIGFFDMNIYVAVWRFATPYAAGSKSKRGKVRLQIIYIVTYNLTLPKWQGDGLKKM